MLPIGWNLLRNVVGFSGTSKSMQALLSCALLSVCGASVAETTKTYLDCVLEGRVTFLPTPLFPNREEQFLRPSRVSLVIADSPTELTFSASGNPLYGFHISIDKRGGESKRQFWESVIEDNRSTPNVYNVYAEYTRNSREVVYRESLTLDRISGQINVNMAELLDAHIQTNLFGKCQKAANQKPQF